MTDQRGVVAAGHAVTAQAAADILREGGNAFDAAIAAMATACVPEFVFSSIGGGGFLMALEASTGEARLYDFFAQTPRLKRQESELDFYVIEADFGPATQEFHIGAGSTAVPSLVHGLYAVHGDLATLEMPRLLEPAIEAARNGVAVSELHAYLYTIVAPILTATAEARAHFAPDGKTLEAGALYKNPDFAGTLEALAREGPDLFTHGAVAKAIAAQSQEFGGHLTLNDLQRYRVERRAPLSWPYRAHEILLNPAPAASGALIAFGLGLLDRLGSDAPDPLTLARVMEETNTVRMAQGDALHEIVSDAALAEHLAALRDHSPATRGTTHISVIDAAGNAASATITNGEGNGHVVDGCGFMLNNMLGEEDLNPTGFNLWAVDTRLSSMMAPTLMRGPGGAVTALGSGGSNRIRTAILQVIVSLLDGGMDLGQAVNTARVHVERDGTVSFEDGPDEARFGPQQRDALLAAFPDAHLWPEANLFFGGVHAARRHGNGAFEGAGDPRRGGVAIVV
ncbi:MAG: gamma-glutamyltransferase [Hyphomicrobiales bacterium]|nr:gamma-glutamyltransferase [Hyphomicrobiales bacterium]